MRISSLYIDICGDFCYPVRRFVTVSLIKTDLSVLLIESPTIDVRHELGMIGLFLDFEHM